LSCKSYRGRTKKDSCIEVKWIRTESQGCVKNDGRAQCIRGLNWQAALEILTMVWCAQLRKCRYASIQTCWHLVSFEARFWVQSCFQVLWLMLRRFSKGCRERMNTTSTFSRLPTHLPGLRTCSGAKKKKRSLSTPSSQNATLVLTTPHFSLQHVSWGCLVSHRMWHSTRFFPYSVANLELSTGCTASMIYHVLGLAVRTAVCRIMRNAG
jgi:hypothetical protein